MSKLSQLNRLITELCPHGVDYVSLGEFALISTGEQLNLTKMAEDSQYPVMNGGVSPSGHYDEFNTEENTITISQGGASAGYVNFLLTKFWAGAHCYVVKPVNERLNNKYLFYFLKNSESKIQGAKYGAGIPGLNKSTLENLFITLPPLPVQEEIVRILDTFTALETELEAELAARTGQYEHYRNSLLEYDDDSDVEWRAIGDIAECLAGATPSTSKNEYWEDGTIPWMNSGEVNLGQVYSTENMITDLGYESSSTKLVPANTVVVALAGQGKTRGKVAITRIPLCTNQSLCSIVPIKDVNSDYLYHYLKTQYQNLRTISSGDGTRGGLNLKMIKGYQVPIPSLDEQIRIVSILDRFETLVNDLKSGLPAEIALRQKQYEYYRNELLAFREK